MKSVFSREFYEANWGKFMEPVVNEHYINLEDELKKEMAVYENIGLTEKDINTIKKLEAQKIADKCLEMVLKDRDIVKKIQNGEASFGMTTERQEIEVRGRFVKRFEFNCLQLRKFKDKYLA